MASAKAISWSFLAVTQRVARRVRDIGESPVSQQLLDVDLSSASSPAARDRKSRRVPSWLIRATRTFSRTVSPSKIFVIW